MSSDSENLVALILINKYLLLKKQKHLRMNVTSYKVINIANSNWNVLNISSEL